MISSVGSGTTAQLYAVANAGNRSFEAAMLRKIKESQVVEGRQAVELIESASLKPSGGGAKGQLIDTFA